MAGQLQRISIILFSSLAFTFTYSTITASCPAVCATILESPIVMPIDAVGAQRQACMACYKAQRAVPTTGYFQRYGYQPFN